MALAGTLRDFGLPDIVQLIGLQRKTGTLHLKTEGEAVKVIFESGNIVAAESSLGRPADRIGRGLVNSGAITQAQLEDALSVQKQSMQRLGHVLISENLVSLEVLTRAVEGQLFQVVFRLFRWREGEYNFETQNTVDYERTGAVALGADFVLMEGIRMVDEWPIIERRIPSMASVFKRVVDSSQVQSSKPASGLDGIIGGVDSPSGADLSLSGDELIVFQAVDGKRSCEQLVDATPLHDFAVCRTLLDLMDRDLVALTDLKGATTKAQSGVSGGVPAYAFMALAILAVLFGVYRSLTSPFRVLGLPALVQPAADSALDTRVMERLEIIDARVRGFRLAYGRLPSSLDELVSEGFATKATVAGVTFKPSPEGFRVEAPGASGAVHLDRTLVRAKSAQPDPEASPSPLDAMPGPGGSPKG